jgi:lysozyme
MIISNDQATALQREDLEATELFVDSVTSSARTSDNQFAAMVSLCFNIGSGNFRSSSVLKDHRAQDAAAAANAFLLWDKAHADGRLEWSSAFITVGRVRELFTLRPTCDPMFSAHAAGA